MELMTDEIAARLRAAAEASMARESGQLPLDGVEYDCEQQPVAVKYFTPDGACSWYILDGTEEDGDEGPDWRLFGLCDLGFGFPELGYVCLSDLREIRGGIGLRVERDLHWTGTLADARRRVAGPA